MLMDKEKSLLVLVDVQEKLTPYVLNSESLVTRCSWLMNLATELKVPILVSEQYPSGLGNTVSSLQSFPEVKTPITKVHFSCFAEPSFVKCFQDSGKTQAILAGIETHVCVLQTAIGMMEAGIEVYVVVDAVSSRTDLDYKYGLKRMKNKGIQLVTSEMVFFEWLRQAGTAQFKTLSQQFLPRSNKGN